MKFELNQTYITNEGVNVICYEKTERYSFLCPFEIIDEGDSSTLRKHIDKTTIYTNEDIEDEENPSPVKIIESYFKKEEE